MSSDIPNRKTEFYRADKPILFAFRRVARLMLHERRSASVFAAPGPVARPPDGGASGLGAELPAARHSRAGQRPVAQTARQFLAKFHQVFCDGGRVGNDQRPFLARQSQQHHLPALATPERPQKEPFGGLAAEWSCFAGWCFPIIRLRHLQAMRVVLVAICLFPSKFPVLFCNPFGHSSLRWPNNHHKRKSKPEPCQSLERLSFCS